MSRKIAGKISLATLSLTIAVVLMVGLASYLFNRHILKEQIEEKISFAATILSHRMETRLDGINDDLQSMATNLIVVNALIDSEGRNMYIEPFLASYRTHHDIHCLLTLCNFEGKPLVSCHGSKNLRTYSDEPLLEQVITKEQPLARIERNDSQLTLLIVYPVFYGATGKAEGMLSIEIPLAHTIENYIPQQIIDKGKIITVSDDKGEVWTNANGDSVPVISSTSRLKPKAPLDQLGLTLTVAETTNQAFSSLNTMTTIYLAIGAVIIILAVTVSQIIGKQLTIPLLALTKTANQIAEGGIMDVRLASPGTDEISQLASSFNIMLARLQDSQATLEARVEERTLQLSDTTQTLNTILENVPIGIAKVIDRKQVWTNRKIEEMFQCSKEEMECQTIRNLYPSDEAYEALGREAYPVLTQGLVFETEQELVRKDGVHILVRYIGKALAPQDMSQGTIWLLEDITERKRAEETIKENEEKFRTIANYTYAWEIWENPMGGYLYCSPSCKRVTGYSAEAFMANSGLLERLIHPEDLLKWQTHRAATHDEPAETQKAVNGLANEIDFRLLHADGEVRWISHTCYPIRDEEGRNLGHRISNREITDRKKAEEALRRSEETLKRAQAVAEIGSWRLDIPENRLEWSEETYRLFGIPQQQDINIEAFIAIIHPDDRDKVLTAWDATLAGAPYDIVHRIVVREKVLWVRERAEIERDRDGRPLSGLGTVQNITDRKQAEDQIKKLAKELQTILDTLTVGVSFIKNRKVQWANPAHDKIFGYAPEECRGLDTSTFYADEESYKRVGEGYAQLIHGTAYTTEVEMKTKDGKRLWCSLTGRAINPDDPQEGSIWMIQDISERKAAADRLRSFAEMQTVLLREVNHRVKNNLVAIISMLHQEEDLAQRDGRREYLDRLQEVVWRVSGLLTVHRLLSSSEWNPLPISSLCENVIQDTLKGLPPGRSIELQIAPSEICVDSDQAHYLTMVLNELTTNTIKYAFRDRERGAITVSITNRDDSIEILYHDDGPGFPETVVQGKFPDNGIGFPLVVGLITKSMGGTITLANDNGALARITFPVRTFESAT